MKLTWVNHASYILESGGLRIITDPWLHGSAFDNGWQLLCESAFSIQDFDGITHIWFSHEHPDHFSPPVLTAIPQSIRAGITVLFQSTKDRRVAKFCEKLGFNVMELPNREPVTLSDNVTLTCGRVRPIDSWLFIETPDIRILNLNDCIIDNDTKNASIQRTVGNIDLLLTQFAYAQWVGNPDEASIMDAAKQEKFRRIQLQCESFRPKWVCPFASFVYFSHQENQYLNEHLATVHEAVEFIDSTTDAASIVFYPGDEWHVGEEWNNKPSLVRYNDDYKKRRLVAESSPAVHFDELQTLAEIYLKNARRLGVPSAILWWARYHSKLMKRPWTLKLHLTDTNIHVEFDWKRGLALTSNLTSEIEISSSSLAYILKHDWGCGTIRVNGKYRATADGRKVFTEFFPFGTLHSVGKSLNWRFILSTLTERLLRRLTGYSSIETEEELSFAGLWEKSTTAIRRTNTKKLNSE